MSKKAVVLLFVIFSAVGFCRASDADKTAFYGNLAGAFRQGSFPTAADKCEAYYEQRRLKTPEANLDELYKDETARTAVFLHFIFKQVLNKGKRVNRNPEFFQWLLKNPDILEEITRFSSARSASWSTLNEIWRRENKSLEGIDRKMAVGAALSASDSGKEGRIKRYFFYKKAFSENKLQPGFEGLSPAEFAILFKSPFSCDDLAWSQNYLASKKLLNTGESYGNRMCRLIPYRKFNAKGVSVQRGAAFYDNKPETPALLLEYGGVCGAVSRGGMGLLHARGIPAFLIGQPGHCALVWKSPGGHWKIANDIYGWAWSTGTNKGTCPWTGTPALIFKHAAFLEKKESALSDFYLTAAEATTSKKNKIFYLKHALRVCPENFRAYSMLAGLVGSENEKALIAGEISRIFKNDPIISEQLLPAFHDFKSKKARKRSYELWGNLLSSESARPAHDIYLRNVLQLIADDIPELRGVLIFSPLKRGTFFKEFSACVKGSKNKNSSASKLIAFTEENFCFLKKNPLSCSEFLTFYCELVALRSDKEQTSRSIRFFENELSVLSRSADNANGPFAAEIRKAKRTLEALSANRS